MIRHIFLALLAGCFLFGVFIAFITRNHQIEVDWWRQEYWLLAVLLVFPGSSLVCCYVVLLNLMMIKVLSVFDTFLLRLQRKSGTMLDEPTLIAKFLRLPGWFPNWLRPVVQPSDVLQFIRFWGWCGISTGVGLMSVVTASFPIRYFGLAIFGFNLGVAINTWLLRKLLPSRHIRMYHYGFSERISEDSRRLS